MVVTLKLLRGNIASGLTPVILIPGITGQPKQTFSTLSKAYEKDSPVFVLDIDLKGASFKSFHDLVDAIFEAIKSDKRISSKPVLGGWSLGGMLAFELAKKYELAGNILPGLHIFDANLNDLLSELEGAPFRARVLKTLQDITTAVMPSNLHQLFQIQKLTQHIESISPEEALSKDGFLDGCIGKVAAYIHEVATLLRLKQTYVDEDQATLLLSVQNQLITALDNLRLLVDYKPTGITNTQTMIFTAGENSDKGCKQFMPQSEHIFLEGVTHLNMLTKGAKQVGDKVREDLFDIDRSPETITPPTSPGSLGVVPRTSVSPNSDDGIGEFFISRKRTLQGRGDREDAGKARRKLLLVPSASTKDAVAMDEVNPTMPLAY